MKRDKMEDWLMFATGITGLIVFVVIVYAAIWIPETQDNKLFIHLMGMVEGVVLSQLFGYFFTSSGKKPKPIDDDQIS